MKKITLLLMTTLLVGLALNATSTVKTIGDTLIIAKDGDTLRLAGTQGIKKLAGLLDDTVINLNDLTGEVAQTDEAPLNRRMNTYMEMQDIWSDTLESITAIVVWGIVVLVAFVLLFSYLKRRRKYKMVEKAIEKNYPLPPYIFDGYAAPAQQYRNPAPQQGTPLYTDQPVNTAPLASDDDGEVVPPPLNAADDPWTAPQQPATVPTRINWRAFQSSFVLVAVGLVLMLMFYDSRMMGICSIPVIIGLGKGFIEYQDQRDAIDAWRNRK